MSQNLELGLGVLHWKNFETTLFRLAKKLTLVSKAKKTNVPKSKS